MDYVKDININEAVIHILDNNSEEPVFNEFCLNLDEEIYSFLLRHVVKVLRDEELKFGNFFGERNLVKELSQEYLCGKTNLIETSKELVRQLFVLMKSNVNIPSCDLIVVSISTEFGPMLGIVKMDYVKNYIHTVDFINNKIGINIIPQFAGLPSSGSKISKCAFIKRVDSNDNYDLMVLDKLSRSKEKDEYGANYFITNYLGCKLIQNERDLTKKFIKAAENWTSENFSEDADTAEKVRRSIKNKIRNEESIDVNNLSEEIFKDQENMKNSFKEYVVNEGIGETINVDREWVDRKLKRKRLKIDKDIDIYINEETYNDEARFEIKRNGDGSINMIIKNVRNYMEK